MYLLYVGVTHQESSISLLEKVHFTDEEMRTALLSLKEEKSILENVILSTCNRTELYLVVDQLHTGRYYSKHFLARWFDLPVEELEKHLQVKEENAVLEHLLRVSIGLESKIIGETQILGQLKQAFLKAQELGTTGMLLNKVFQQVVTFAKRMHDSYRINDRPISIGLTSVQLLDQLQLDDTSQKVAIVGLGEIGQQLAKYMVQKPFARISLINRTIEKSQPFLGYQAVSVHPWEELERVVSEADIIFLAVKYDGYLLLPHMLKPGTIVFDLCLPRVCHPNSTIQLYNIDNITNQLDAYHAERESIAQKMSSNIVQELDKFEEWRQQLGVLPLIKEIRENALQIQKKAMESLYRKLPNLTERESKQISKHMKSIINQMIREPILQLKEMSVGENSQYDMDLIARVFGLTKQMEELHDESD